MTELLLKERSQRVGTPPPPGRWGASLCERAIRVQVSPDRSEVHKTVSGVLGHDRSMGSSASAV